MTGSTVIFDIENTDHTYSLDGAPAALSELLKDLDLREELAVNLPHKQTIAIKNE